MNVDLPPSDQQVPAAPPGQQVRITPLLDRQELFCQAIVAGSSLVDAYHAAGYASTGRAITVNATRLRATRAVSERIDALTALAAERAVIDRSVLLQQLYELATADVAELVSVITEPCAACWPDEQLALAVDRAAAGQGKMPDPESPRTGCATCRGRGVKRLSITDTHDLSGAARRLFAGAQVMPDGSIRVNTVDQLAARRELHDLLGMRVRLSENKNLNINATVAAPPSVTAADVLDLWHASRDAP